MRYQILKPLRESTFDPRHETVKDAEQFRQMIPSIADVLTEREAVTVVRSMFPHAQAMPFPMPIGSGATVLLGFVEDPSIRIDPDDDIPFVAFVQAITQDDADRRDVKAALVGKYPLFDQNLWKLAPIRPELGAPVAIEWRTTELDAPAYLDARVGYDAGRLVIFAEMGEHAMSVRLPDGYRLVKDE